VLHLVPCSFARRIHAVDATVGGLDGFESSSSRASASVSSREFRGPRGPSQLAGAPQAGVERRQVFNLPPMRVRVTEHRLITRRCGYSATTT
jgi:hypothetical protein